MSFEVRHNKQQFAQTGDGRVLYHEGELVEGQRPYELEIYSNPPVVDQCKTVLVNVNEDYVKSMNIEYYNFSKDKDDNWECVIYFSLN